MVLRRLVTLGFAIAVLASSSQHGLADKKATTQFERLALKRNFKTLAKSLQAAAKADDADALYRLGSLYRLGMGVEKDEARARSLLAKSAGRGSKKAAQLLRRLNAATPAPTGSVTPPVKAAAKPFLPEVQADVPDAAGLTWLTRAAVRGQIEALSSLLSLSESRPAENTVSLLQASAAGKLQSSILLLKSGSSVNATDAQGRSPLLLAAAAGNGKLAAELIVAGADIAHRDADGRTVLHYAISNCRREMIESLLRNGAPLFSTSDGQSPLHMAVRYCPDSDLVNTLAALQDVDAADSLGRTAMWYSSSLGQDDINAILLARGAHADIADTDGMTPLHAAAWHANPAIVSALVGSGVMPEAETTTGNTALMFAAARNCTACIAALVSAKADIDHKNAQGDTALIFAARSNSRESAVHLMAAGARPDIRNARRETALLIAQRLGNDELARILSPE